MSTLEPELSPMFERLRVAVLDLWSAIPERIVDETQALIELDPTGSMRGIRLEHSADDYVEVVWGGRHIGTIDYRWLATGQPRSAAADE